MMRALLVDDELAARRRLARLLTLHSDVEIVGEAKDGLEALQLAETLTPDVIFLDIQMPELDGFGVVRGLSALSPMPLVIFATSFDQHALAAFEANALAYLLKPVETTRLESALERARLLLISDTERALDEQRVRAIAGSPSRLRRIVARKGSQIVLLDPEDVHWFYMDSGIVKAKTANESYWLNHQLGELETSLDPDMFFRARRETVVNLHKVKGIKPYDRSTFVLVMSDLASTELTVSERQAKELRQRLPGL